MDVTHVLRIATAVFQHCLDDVLTCLDTDKLTGNIRIFQLRGAQHARQTLQHVSITHHDLQQPLSGLPIQHLQLFQQDIRRCTKTSGNIIFSRQPHANYAR
ncbi:hypothetical protein DYGSA30_32650 [Dyella sp. GSA-30]|nr:hypothetical protein DYGSA30_32650 [Dyella sp. GSA-30]